jgi:uncharacterized protein
LSLGKVRIAGHGNSSHPAPRPFASPKDEQRAVFQPVAVATFVVAGLGLGVQSALSAKIAWLFLVGLPALFLGTWLGLRFYGRLDEGRFRKIVLFILLWSGVALFFGRP